MSSIVGVLLGLLVLFGANFLEGDAIQSLLKMDAAMIVFGGTISALLVHEDIETLRNAIKHVSWLLRPPKTDAIELIEDMTKWAEIVRKNPLALESATEEVSDHFLRVAIDAVVLRTPAEDLRDMLYLTGDAEDRAFMASGGVWEAAGGYAPTIGVLGAVLGLIHVMLRLNHPSELGGGIATAFVATVYGVGSANLVFFPLGNRLKKIAGARSVFREIATEGFIMLSRQEMPSRMRMRLENMLESRRPPVSDEVASSDAGDPLGEAAD